MHSFTLFILLISTVLIGIDIYAYQCFKRLFEHKAKKFKKRFLISYVLLSVFFMQGFLSHSLISPYLYPILIKTVMIGAYFVFLFVKITICLFVLADDVRRGVKWSRAKIKSKGSEEFKGEKIPRSKFLMQSSLAVAAIPFVSYSVGIISGAYDYRIRRVKLVVPSLPKGFVGMKIVQLSDIHSGSFYNKTAVQGGVDMAMAEKPEVVFFTGDLVNNTSKEVVDYYSIFKQVQAPLGVYSILGNHDYGEYYSWPTEAAKQKNLEDIYVAHKELGWNLLRNENTILKVGGEELPVIGVENWGTGRFPKYGDLKKATAGIEDYDVKFLLSHDPSHWDAQVRKDYKDIDVMFAGHTHGFQMGVDVGGIELSPAALRYKQWAGLYEEEGQQLYVNRGYGFLGYPGRVGISPEITVFELAKS